MRLIDADKVKQYVLTEGFYCDTDADKEATAEKIDQLFPTVEAIPVEWLVKTGLLLTINKNVYCAAVIKTVIEEWEAENEKD